MAVKCFVYSCDKGDSECVVIKSDTLIERLRRMRALNSTPGNIGIRRSTFMSPAPGRKRYTR